MSRSAGSGSGEMPDAIDRLAAGLAADLLASVVEDSRRAAAELLRSRLTAALVERAEELATSAPVPAPPAGTPSPPLPAAPPPPAAPPEPAAPVTPAGGSLAGWYVYGLTRPSPGRPVGGRGIDGAAVETFEHFGIVALMSAVPAGTGDGSLWGLDPAGEVDLEALAPRLQAHERVLEEALARAAVLPFRFGVMYRDRDTVERVIESHAAAVRAELERLEGRAEWGVVLHRSGRAPAPLHSPIGSGRPGGRDYLTQRRDQRSTAARWDEEASEVAASLHGQLADLADEAVAHRPEAGGRKGGRCLMRSSYLIRASRVGDFRRAADELLSGAPAHLGLTGELTGPWPPYHFIAVDLGDSAPADWSSADRGLRPGRGDR